MGGFDQAARYAAQADPAAVVGRVLRGQGLSVRFRDWVDTRTTPRPGERDRTADRVAALDDEQAPDHPWLLVLEYQAQHDADKLDVTLVEAAQLRLEVRHGADRRGKYRVLVALVYLRGACPEDVLDMTSPAGRGTRHAPVVWNLEGDEAGATLDALAAGQTTWGILFWVPLMKGGGEAPTIERWKETARAVPDARTRGDLGQIALVFAELAGCYLAWEKGLEGWEMTESQVVNRWIEKAQRETELSAKREDLLFALQERFPGAIPPELLELISQQESVELLRSWFRAALHASSAQEVIDVLRR